MARRDERQGKEERGSILDSLKEMDFPATKQEILDNLEEKEAPRSLLSRVSQIKDKTYNDYLELKGELMGLGSDINGKFAQLRRV